MVQLHRTATGDFILSGDGDYDAPGDFLREQEALKKSWSALDQEKAEYAERYFRRDDGQLSFTSQHLQSIKEIFGVEAIQPNPDNRAVVVPSLGGRHTIIEPQRISFSGGAPSDQQYRAAIEYVAKHWGGTFYMHANPNGCREHRLKSLAYAQVFGLKFVDENNARPDLALTKAELSKLPELCAHIRRVHPDAPPIRPGNNGSPSVAPAIA